jgi:predicted polyphosphate/ATP-dependent NAD kinase
MKIGLVINPWAGVGGSVALKGSDGVDIRNEALKRGAQPKANLKTNLALQALFTSNNHKLEKIDWYTAPRDMGANALLAVGVEPHTFHLSPETNTHQTEAKDTKDVVRWFMQQDVDVILFAGGDGTARDICEVIQTQIPVLGIPAGVKIHSGVFAVTPHAAGEVLSGLINGTITELRSEEVRDIDEDAFRNGKVKSKHFGDMNVPVSGEYIQHVKVGGIESDELVLNEIAEWVQDSMESNVCYFIGSGKTTATLMERLSLPNTLLGIDAVLNGQIIESDCTEQILLQLMSKHRCCAVLSIIGGQGHIFGRGNAQLSPEVLTKLKRENIWFISSKNKLMSLEGRPLMVDTSDELVNQYWNGLVTVITGYNDQVIYPVVSL